MISQARRTANRKSAAPSAPCWIALLILVTGCVIATAGDPQFSTPPAKAPDRPRLVVLIVVDQLRGDYLTRFADHFCPGGFRRLLDHGAFFPDACISYAASETASGHATIATGRLPRRHGVTGNELLREPGDAKTQPAVRDAEYPIVGPGGKKAVGCSPRALIGSMLGDQLKQGDRRSRVFSVAIKDRAAIFMSAKSADGVFWCDRWTGQFVSSRFYMKQLPAYVEEFNKPGGARRYAERVWEPVLPPEAYAGTVSIRGDQGPMQNALRATFSHRAPTAPTGESSAFCESIFSTPFGNELVFDLARLIVEHERLGRGQATDLLCVSLSSNDYVGHAYGPDSPEVLDMTVRTDRQLAEFFRWLDQQVGLEACLTALTADHGVTPSAPALKQLHVGAQTLDGEALIDDLNRVVHETCAEAKADQGYVAHLDQPWIYCDPSFVALDKAQRGALTRRCLEHLRKTPGIAAAFSADELSGPAPARDDTERWLAWRSFHPGRAGHFYITLAEHWSVKSDDAGPHSGGTRMDRHVPILFAGPGVKPGRYATPADLTDVAVTLAHLLGLAPPAEVDGRVLADAVAVRSPPAESATH